MKALKYSYILFTLAVFNLQGFAQIEDDKTNTRSRIDTAAVIGGVVVDTTSRNNPEEIAKEMATNLMYRLNLSMDQAEKISEILTDYQADIKDTYEKNENDKKEQVGGNVSRELLNEIDSNANQKIEDVLEENQKEAYLFIKNDWWNQVKNRIYNKKDPDNK